MPPRSPLSTPPLLCACVPPRSDQVDEHGFQMQHVVEVHLGVLQEAPHTAVQVRHAALPPARPRPTHLSPAALPSPTHMKHGCGPCGRGGRQGDSPPR
jgi:hypothetical protein